MSKKPLRLTGADLTAADVAGIARERWPVSISSEALERVAQGRAVIDFYTDRKIITERYWPEP